MHHCAYIPQGGPCVLGPYVDILRILCARRQRRCSSVNFRVIGGEETWPLLFISTEDWVTNIEE